MQTLDIEAFPLPTGREEAWRFTPLERIVLGDVEGPHRVQVAGHLAGGHFERVTYRVSESQDSSFLVRTFAWALSPAPPSPDEPSRQAR